ncbi:hypothetical protein PSACC_00304, partial [Paramicrosporidium saccamoebae]
GGRSPVGSSEVGGGGRSPVGSSESAGSSVPLSGAGGGGKSPVGSNSSSEPCDSLSDNSPVPLPRGGGGTVIVDGSPEGLPSAPMAVSKRLTEIHNTQIAIAVNFIIA